MMHLALKINYESIGWFEARRIEGDTNPDSIGTYEVVIEKSPTSEEKSSDYLRGKIPDNEVLWKGQVKHRYGDGAWSLLAKCLKEAGIE